MGHLGGHLNRTWVDEGALKFLVDQFHISSMIDVGCGPAGMKVMAESLNIKWVGIDGDPEVKQDGVITHDFNNGTVEGLGAFDLGWSVEFLEHVYEEYQPHYMNIFSKCNVVLCTAALPGSGGHHHVNEQELDYWVRAFSKYGLSYDEDTTQEIIKKSTMRQKKGTSFMQRSGMFFRRDNGT
jgi:hypothetical protein